MPYPLPPSHPSPRHSRPPLHFLSREDYDAASHRALEENTAPAPPPFSPRPPTTAGCPGHRPHNRPEGHPPPHPPPHPPSRPSPRPPLHSRPSVDVDGRVPRRRVPCRVPRCVPRRITHRVPHGVPRRVPRLLPRPIPGRVRRRIPRLVPGRLPRLVPHRVPGRAPGRVPRRGHRRPLAVARRSSKGRGRRGSSPGAQLPRAARMPVPLRRRAGIFAGVRPLHYDVGGDGRAGRRRR